MREAALDPVERVLPLPLQEGEPADSLVLEAAEGDRGGGRDEEGEEVDLAGEGRGEEGVVRGVEAEGERVVVRDHQLRVPIPE